jgi:hypothetical protein
MGTPNGNANLMWSSTLPAGPPYAIFTSVMDLRYKEQSFFSVNDASSNTFDVPYEPFCKTVPKITGDYDLVAIDRVKSTECQVPVDVKNKAVFIRKSKCLTNNLPIKLKDAALVIAFKTSNRLENCPTPMIVLDFSSFTAMLHLSEKSETRFTFTSEYVHT